jgi:DNA mismatch endonuclease, patch repair protein
MQANHGTDTKPEQAIRSALHRLGLRFRKHQRPVAGIRCTADVVFPRSRVAVFVDGCFWHGCPQHGTRPKTNSHYWDAKLARNGERDRRNDVLLRDAGWTVVRVWEHEAPIAAAQRIATLIRGA